MPVHDAAVIALLATLGFASTACRGTRSSQRDAEVVAPPTSEAALRGIVDRNDIRVVLETDHGAIHCSLDATRTPNGVSLFVGLATGRAAYLEPRTGRVVRQPLYAHRRFFRALPDAYVQSGCPLDDGTGTPGYRIPPEPNADDAARLSAPGALLLAKYTSPPHRDDPSPPPPGRVIGSQFAITMTDMKHLAGTVTVLGRCRDPSVVRDIARARERGELPELVRVTVDGVSSR